ncbi:MAG: hypothetical protein CO187_03355 [Zetaproteobacteria bacterium CG_4_9_14_3_um_filter_53_7]|nr:MAG: hypothetical protein CO187_03355 [Zetaproteobacteria bacterium CG_4_9_14_3_um_filter_53_7]
MSTQKKLKKSELLTMAGDLGLKGLSKYKKGELIHAIQVAEGNAPCFMTISNCAVSPCLFRSECQN